MIQDYNMILSAAQALTTAGTADSTNVLDFGIANPNSGAATPLVVEVTVDTTFTSANSTATLAISLQDSADDSNYTVVWTSETFAIAALTAGARLVSMALPAEHKRYLKIVYTIGTQDFTAGKVNASIVAEAGQS